MSQPQKELSRPGKEPRRSYSKPQLQIYGNLAEITQTVGLNPAALVDAPASHNFTH
jgi:hypothetical protein